MRLRLLNHVPHAFVVRCGLRRAAHVGSTPHTPHARADARRRRVSHRAPALRPHLTHQITMRIRCAHNLERTFFDLFGPPKSGWGSAPRRALQFCRSLWFGRPGRRWPTRMRPQSRRRSVPPHAGWIRFPSLRATHTIEWQHPSHSHSALCRTPRHAIQCAVRTAGGGEEVGCVCVRIAVVADSIPPLRARQCGQAASVL